MGGVISGLFGSKPKGPSAAEKAAQQEQKRQAFKDKAEADKMAALSSQFQSRQRALSFTDQRQQKSQTLGG